MPNIIAKKLNIELDTINQKIKIIKDFIVIIGDSVEITINLKENGLPKNITNCTCRLIGIKENSDPFEQTEKIEIIDEINGVVKIYPRLDIFNIEGKTICCLLVEDADESISVQRFIINVSKSMVTDLIIESKENIETLRELNNLLTEYRDDLVAINQSVIAMESSVAQKTQEIDLGFNELKGNIQGQIDTLQSQIDGVNTKVNYELTKRIKLKVQKVNGSNYHYFTTDIINKPAKSLLRQQFVVTVGGSADTGIYNNSTSILNFYSQNSKVMPFMVNISDRTLGGKNINPSCTYNNLGSELNLTDTGFSLYIKSNLSIATNAEDNIYCYLTPLAEIF